MGIFHPAEDPREKVRPCFAFTSFGVRIGKGAIVQVEPQLVAQAEFQKWPAAGKIRHASFRGLRDDKDASEVVRERREAPPL
jgi:bifunctional non-homologous end joining protein LigD